MSRDNGYPVSLSSKATRLAGQWSLMLVGSRDAVLAIPMVLCSALTASSSMGALQSDFLIFCPP